MCLLMLSLVIASPYDATTHISSSFPFNLNHHVFSQRMFNISALTKKAAPYVRSMIILSSHSFGIEAEPKKHRQISETIIDDR